jgi:uncharacterized protein (DUF1919 family)
VYKLIIWGIGKTYNQYVNVLKYLEFKKDAQIIALTDSNLPHFKCLDNWKIVEKGNIIDIDFDCIVVMSDIYFRDILNDIKNIGIDSDKVISYKILNLSNLDIGKYLKIKKHRITVFSNNCWGGLLYSTLGLECCSPFKNLFVKDDDYLDFLKNAQYYMELDLKFERYEVDAHSMNKYPVMKLGNLEIHCNHDKDPVQATEKWNRRRDKINWDNLLVEMYTEKEQSAREFLDLEQYSNKIVFVPENIEVNKAVKLPMYPKQKEFYETVNRSVSVSGYMYDLLDVMMGEVSFRIK